MKNVRWHTGSMEDFDDVVRLCGLWWKDSLFFKKFKVPYAPSAEIFEQLHNSNSMLSLLARDVDTDELVACYVAVISPYHFNANVTMAQEIVWCVHPDHRKSRLVFDLIKRIDRALGERWVSLGTLSVSQEDKYLPMEKYLEGKAGYSLMDKVFIKEIHHHV